MADKRITQLDALTSLDNADLFVVVDDVSGTPVTKKITAANVKSGLAPTSSPTFTGNVVLPATTSVGDVSSTELGYLDGVTSAIQTQLNGKQAVVSGVDDTEIGYLNGVTSAIQTQLDAKIASSVVDAKGDLLVASADNTVAKLTVGTNNHVLTADTNATNGVKWAAIPAPTIVWDDDQNIIANSVFG